jgi:hypothetical protein
MKAIKWMLGALLLTTGVRADDPAALAAQLKGAKVSLAQGLKASATKGKPISGKYEIEDGKLQLSVYTAKGDAFSEVIVDHKTGKVAKAEPITSGDDLKEAKEQNEAMSSAKISLMQAVANAERMNKGYHATSAIPAAKDGHPQAAITLMKGAESKTESIPLD